MIYFPVGSHAQRSLTLVLRGGNAASLAPAVARLVAELDPALPPPALRELAQLVGFAMATRRFALVLFGVFAGLALVLAALGLYGVMAYLVRQRAREFGVRCALGSSSKALVRLVVGRAMRLSAIGVAIGLIGAWLLTGTLSTLLYDVPAADPLTFAAIVALLVVVTVLASAVPARRAARADPMVALRGE
jgi:ABC-type antimicrobial peptide transport system permease subunit